MANHGVTSLSMVEDMRPVLIAYWGVAAKRITENICMLFETHLLASIGQDVEKRLLGYAQREDGAVADELLRQDAAVEREREEVRSKKTRVAGALNALARFAPAADGSGGDEGAGGRSEGDDDAHEMLALEVEVLRRAQACEHIVGLREVLLVPIQ